MAKHWTENELPKSWFKGLLGYGIAVCLDDIPVMSVEQIKHAENGFKEIGHNTDKKNGFRAYTLYSGNNSGKLYIAKSFSRY